MELIIPEKDSIFKKSLKFIKHDYQLLIAGDTKPLNFDGKYKFVKLPKSFNMRRLVFNSADMLIVPSTHEAFGLVSIEAAACNTQPLYLMIQD